MRRVTIEATIRVGVGASVQPGSRFDGEGIEAIEAQFRELIEEALGPDESDGADYAKSTMEVRVDEFWVPAP